jgi:tripartite-type tricarboxylate transporter receptor subunit TctC
MTLNRRTLLASAVSAACLIWTLPSAAQSFPSKPVRILVGFAAGGTGDMLARMVAEKLAQMWAQPVVVENRPGASGTIALEAVARSAPDGYTMGMLTMAQVVAGELVKLSYRVDTDLTPIAGIAQQANILVVNPSLPVATVSELIQYLKTRPRAVSFASGGSGTPGHVAGELFMQKTGVEIVHVPYKRGPPALQDVIAGHVGMMFAPAPPALALLKAGKLRALAVTSNTRSTAMPELPTLAESGIDFDIRDWHGMVGPARMPADVASRISGDVLKVLSLPEVRQRIADMTGEVLPGSPTEFGGMVGRETIKWRAVVKQGKLSAD